MAQRTLTRESDGQKRLALIIGNGDYANARKLVNPPNDATDMTATLTELGFEVISGTNLNLRQMRREIGYIFANYQKLISQSNITPSLC